MNSWVKDKKLTAANSHMVEDLIFYVAKMMDNGKPAGMYWAYTYPSGYAVRGDSDKSVLLEWLNNNHDKIEDKLKEKGLI